MSTLMQDNGPIADGQKVMLASTAYDSADASYTFAIQQSREALTDAGIQSAYTLLSGNCHVDDARNSVVHAFMQSDCTDLVFLDADVSWQKQDLVKLCQFDLDLVGGVYPYKRDEGRGMPFMPLDGAEMKDGLIEVAGLPTGFMRIRRNVFETLIPLHKTFDNFQKNITDIPLLFERTLEDGTRFGGDINFCLRWADAGGKLYAYTEATLGHAVKTVIHDSLGAFIRRKNHLSIQHVAERVEQGIETHADLIEALTYVNNGWSVDSEMLSVVIAAARKADGPIIETGSGITTILMAAANRGHQIWCLEHNPHFADITRQMARACGLDNIMMIHCDIQTLPDYDADWYNVVPEDKLIMPAHFALGFNDGPPRHLSDRTVFLDEYGHRCDMIVNDDAQDIEYATTLTTWAEGMNRAISFPSANAAIIMEDAA